MSLGIVRTDSNRLFTICNGFRIPFRQKIKMSPQQKRLTVIRGKRHKPVGRPDRLVQLLRVRINFNQILQRFSLLPYFQRFLKTTNGIRCFPHLQGPYPVVLKHFKIALCFIFRRFFGFSEK